MRPLACTSVGSRMRRWHRCGIGDPTPDRPASGTGTGPWGQPASGMGRWGSQGVARVGGGDVCVFRGEAWVRCAAASLLKWSGACFAST
ncbi:hypothetical protein T484DRAFT_2909801 [Baffinella frigidus]|nr:hypothetical protein T484DRAFT_2909801 [Cryptophyta sp. CCMP2293]